MDPYGCPPEIARELHTAAEFGLSIFGAGAMLERVLVSFRRVKKDDTYSWAMFVRGSDEDKRSLRDTLRKGLGANNGGDTRVACY